MEQYRFIALIIGSVLLLGCAESKEAADTSDKMNTPQKPWSNSEPSALSSEAINKGMPPQSVLLLVRVSTQTMTLLIKEKVIATFSVSCSSLGVGNKAGSYKTPTGLHRVSERIGDGEPLGRVFVGRVAQDRIIPETKWNLSTGKDLVLTRILRLEGMEKGTNKGKGIDSLKRLIYIHGTNEEHLLGSPASHGCVRMANKDVYSLFNATRDRDTWCLIVE